MKKNILIFFFILSIILFVVTTYFWVIGGFNIAGRGSIGQLKNMHIIIPIIFLSSSIYFLTEIDFNNTHE